MTRTMNNDVLTNRQIKALERKYQHGVRHFVGHRSSRTKCGLHVERRVRVAERVWEERLVSRHVTSVWARVTCTNCRRTM